MNGNMLLSPDALHCLKRKQLTNLCKRFGIDLSGRAKHGALLDAELTARVYLELVGGRQTKLVLAPGDSLDAGEVSRGEVGTGGGEGGRHVAGECRRGPCCNQTQDDECGEPCERPLLPVHGEKMPAGR